MNRTVVALLLSASLLTTAPSLFEPVWGFLSSLWAAAETDAGCGMDPFGPCAPAAQPATDEGCGVDPFGCPK